ncbi:hypothetical protein PY093_01615 [Cytobacillus sp. S13-E01]|uniref:hypothetical protein n=1 Tax=Cytobacillus sp. S13-E01 TaxID=3031326 RepID=UPI0023D7FA35|nr:hypothetical protein [Cytobacillus sp. S13-E01]MDF0725406.1 hypothetical protein [Cytobacillus sp. S13-E01]
MEFSLKCKGNVYPCEVTIDEDNGRYTVRKADSSGEFFNTPEALVSWVLTNWNSDEFDDKDQFDFMLKEIQSYFPIGNQ